MSMNWMGFSVTILVAVLKMEMLGAEEMTKEESTEEPLFGVLDIVLLVALLGIAGWWLMKRKSRENANSQKTYTIQ